MSRRDRHGDTEMKRALARRWRELQRSTKAIRPLSQPDSAKIDEILKRMDDEADRAEKPEDGDKGEVTK